jgi:hypothetical protein
MRLKQAVKGVSFIVRQFSNSTNRIGHFMIDIFIYLFILEIYLYIFMIVLLPPTVCTSQFFFFKHLKVLKHRELQHPLFLGLHIYSQIYCSWKYISEL